MTDLTPLSDASAGIHALDLAILSKLTSRNNRKQRLTENTKKVYAAVIRDFNRFLASRNLVINEESIAAYFRSIATRLAPATINHRKYALLKIIKAQFGQDSVLRTLAIEKAFERIPTYHIEKAVGNEKVLTEAKIGELMAVAGEKTRLTIAFLFKTGCRVSEMIGVRLIDCQARGQYCHIRIVGKGRKVREVIIPTALCDEIFAVYQGTRWLFESTSGGQLDRRNVWVQIKKVGERIGLSTIHPHMLRHTRATDMITNKGVSTKAASLYLGHSSTATTLDMYVKDKVNIKDLFHRDLI